jgi:catechol 2,3-dioxygenase-like lactoylglutathione lyase family enzyme
MILGVNHITLSVPSLEEALAFYCDLLGFELVARMSWKSGSGTSVTAGKIMGIDGTAADAAHLRCSNLVLELFEFSHCEPASQHPERPPIDHGYSHFCLAVSDIDSEYRRLKSAGMRFLGEPIKVAPGVVSVYGRDPFGNLIELEEAAGRVVSSVSALEAARERLFNLALGVGLFAIFLAFFLWQTPWLWNSPLSQEDIDHYTAELQQHTVMEPEHKAAFISRVREWAAGDDGRPVLLVNLMRYRDTLGELPPGTAFEGTPAEINEYYEQLVVPLALKRGEYPLIGGSAQAPSLTASDFEDANQWERVVVMRAPSRRAYIEFMADPAYGPAIPLKLAAEEVVLIPIDADMVVPDLRWLVGGLLLITYLAIRWRRSTRALRRASLAHKSGALA